MTLADYLLIAIVVVSAIIGLVRGFLKEVVSVLTWIVALVAAWQFGPALEPHLGGLLASPDVRPWAARTILFIVVLLVGAGIGALIGHFVRLSLFNGADRFLGLLFGLARGVVVLGLLVILGQLLRLDSERWWGESRVLPYAEGVADALRALVGDELRLRGMALSVCNPGFETGAQSECVESSG